MFKSWCLFFMNSGLILQFLEIEYYNLVANSEDFQVEPIDESNVIQASIIKSCK